MELLQQLLDIYKKKHPSDWEKWFNKMAQDLIDTSDVSRAEYIRFCAESDVFIKPKRTARKSSSSSSSSDWGSGGGCGSSGRQSTRGGC